MASQSANRQISISEWFGLNRDNYILNPRECPEDAAFYARRVRSLNIEEQISRLEVDLEAKLTPKKIYWGPYGGGKTHTLYKILYELGERVDIHTVFVECPTLKSSSTFAVLYEKTMNQMGMDFVLTLLRDALNDVARKTGLSNPEEAVKKLCLLLGDDDLGRAVYQLTQPSSYFDPMVLWRWLSASGISSRDKVVLRVTSDLKIADPEKLANILLTIGKLLTNYKNETLVLVYDELDRAKALGKDPIGTFSTAFTTLTDLSQTSVSVFLATSANRIADVPGIITAAVKSRVGSDDLKEIPPMVTEDLDPFLKDLILYNRRGDLKVDALINKARMQTNEHIDPDLYPFSRDAIEAIRVKLGRDIVPRDISRIMSRSASYAKNKMNLNIITKKAVEDS
jgi:hypothetical protein